MIVGTGGRSGDRRAKPAPSPYATILRDSNTFALEYKANALQLATFSNRTITVIPLN